MIGDKKLILILSSLAKKPNVYIFEHCYHYFEREL